MANDWLVVRVEIVNSVLPQPNFCVARAIILTLPVALFNNGDFNGPGAGREAYLLRS